MSTGPVKRPTILSLKKTRKEMGTLEQEHQKEQQDFNDWFNSLTPQEAADYYADYVADQELMRQKEL